MAELTDQSIATIIAHMNDDHADSTLAYVRHFAGRTDAEAATIASLDALGLDVVARCGDADVTLRIPFDHPLQDTDDARNTLVAMARAAG
jgi:putative heme iron utilization protein